MTEQYVVRMSRVEKVYEDYHLGPVNLELEPGFVYAIMGRNGSGKSTLFRLLNGQSQPGRGEIRWFGGITGEGTGPDHPAMKRRVAYVPDDLDIPDHSWSMRKWKAFASSWYSQWNERVYKNLVKRYGLEENKPMAKASKGTKRKAALVIALAQEPEVLLLDEPSAGLDPFAWRMMLEDLSDYMASGNRTIIMATHILEEIKRLGDYLYFLDEGELYGSFEKDALNDQWRMMWVDRLPADYVAQIPGIVGIDGQLPLRLISNSPQATAEALNRLGIVLENSRPLELDEIFWHVVRINKAENIKKGAINR